MQTRQALDGLDVAERPRLSLRILDHWDNLDGSVERGYAGPSIWPWGDLPGRVRRASSSTPRERVDRHQRLGAQQRERQRRTR